MKQEKGITLIALVITIIILLILAGISIATLTGQNGLLSKAETAKENTRGANVKEQVELWKSEKRANEYYSDANSKIMTEKELLDDLELSQKILLNNERTTLETERQVIIGNQTITLEEEKKEAPTSVYAKLYSYKDGKEGKILELCSDSSYIDSEYNLEDDYDLKDIGQIEIDITLNYGYGYAYEWPWLNHEFLGSAMWNVGNTEINQVKIVDEISPISLAGFFYGCSNITNIEGLEKINTTRVIHMTEMFTACNNLTQLDLTNFNTSTVTAMRGMFAYCTKLEKVLVDASKWNVNEEDKATMFEGCNISDVTYQ